MKLKELQAKVEAWMYACFTPEIVINGIERNHRFFEEATELVQARHMTRAECHQLVDYTFDRPVGEERQEVGGVLVTLTALCNSSNHDMTLCAKTEIQRIWDKIDTIREKQANKPKHSPLPE